MENVMEYVARRDRLLFAALALGAFLAGLVLVVAPFAGWVFVVEPNGERVTLGAGFVCLWLFQAAYVAVAAVRQRIERRDVFEMTFLIPIFTTYLTALAVGLVPTAIAPIAGCLLAIVVVVQLKRRLSESLRRVRL